MSRRMAVCVSVALANLIPILGVWLFGWSLEDTVAYFMAEMWIFALYAMFLHALSWEWNGSPVFMTLIGSFFIIQLLALGMPIIDNDFQDAQARAWIVFIAQTMPWAVVGVLGSRLALLIHRWTRTDPAERKPFSTGGESAETGVRALVMFFAVFFTLYANQGLTGKFDPIIFLSGLVLGKTIFEMFAELTHEPAEKKSKPNRAEAS